MFRIEDKNGDQEINYGSLHPQHQELEKLPSSLFMSQEVKYTSQNTPSCVPTNGQKVPLFTENNILELENPESLTDNLICIL